jgi:hypothetical protein
VMFSQGDSGFSTAPVVPTISAPAEIGSDSAAELGYDVL